MALETGSYISALVATNPTATDPKSQGDDHHRFTKAKILETFPNITGAVTPTHTELNYVDGVTSAIQTQLDAKGAKAGQTWTGNHDYTGATYVRVPAPAVGADAVTKTYADGLAFAAALPAQAGNSGKYVTTNGTTASWATIAQIFAAAYESSGQTITSAGTLTLAHGLGAAPELIQLELKCTTTNLNYSVNDRVVIQSGMNTTNTGASITYDATNVYVTFGSAGGAFTILDKSTGSTAQITNASWQLFVKAWA